MSEEIDITVILPPTNKAGLNLASILKKDSMQKEFKKVVSIIRSYNNANQHLLERQVTMQYIYDILYDDYKNKIKTKFIPKYGSYVLCILHKKYVDFLNELKEFNELIGETEETTESVKLEENSDNEN